MVRLLSCLRWYNTRLAKCAQSNLPRSHTGVDKTRNEHRVCPRINVEWFASFALWIFKTINFLENTWSSLQKVQQLTSYFQKIFLPRSFEKKIFMGSLYKSNSATCWMWKKIKDHGRETIKINLFDFWLVFFMRYRLLRSIILIDIVLIKIIIIK